jgi:hypothetical protein
MINKNLEKGFLLIFSIIILGLGFVIAHEISVGSGSLSTSFNFRQTVINTYNITINNTDTGALGTNVSMVYITLPLGFNYIFNSSLVGGNTSGVIFSNTSNILNWTNATTNALIFNQTNQSRISFIFNATASTPGIYLFNVSTKNSTGINNYTISVTINDTVAPNLTDFGSLGVVIGGNNLSQSSLPINISATDNGFLKAIIIKLAFANGTLACYSNGTNVPSSNYSGNNTLAYPNTNSSILSWFINYSILADGYYNVSAWVNDSANNLNISMLNVTLDTVKPVNTFSCTPTSVNTGQIVTCSCTATDATSGVKTITYTGNPSTSSDGLAQSTTCTSTDYAGNVLTSTVYYDVFTSNAAPSTGGSTTYTKTYIPSDAEFKSGYTSELKNNERVKLTIDSKTHYLGITTLTTTSATISVASTPQTATLTIGEEKKFDVTADGYYDLSAKLNSITNSKASLTVKSIYEKISAVTVSETQTTEPSATTASPAGEVASTSGNKMIWISAIAIIVIVLIWIGYNQYKKRK